ncbi:MAG: DNA mismatch repair endonuclease MutL [Phycisphaerales bacterium]|nr:DNA mismatch repair endonuclease MutL [Phycisphaerales bacterium]
MPVGTAAEPGESIRPLPALLVNQIAAGEVVERPASVVKELVENALDAGAARITVELEQGGIELIRVSDDGRGIDAEQLALAVAPHATSKLREAADLDRIGTLGFRGEALASIASVSRLLIRSRTRRTDAAAQIDAEGDRVSPVAPASGPAGTAVTVRNLFFNTPARRKFLRTPPTESSRCADVVCGLAMAHPDVGFCLTADGRRTLDLSPGQTPRQRVLAVLGPELEDQLLEVHADAHDGARGITLWGLVGQPALARATAQSQHVFLNGRVVRDRTVQHAIKESFRGLIEPGRHPTAVLMLEMDPASVDVNVHPAKTEVRFRDSSLVHSTVLRSIRDALRRADLTPTLASASGGPRAILSPAAGAFVDAFTRDLPAAAGGALSYGAIRAAMDAAGAPPAAVPPPAGDQSLPPAVPASRVLQVHNSYLVTQDAAGVVIIDQHALHERVMFEALIGRVHAGPLESQRLLTPSVVPASPRQIEALGSLTPLLSRIGLEALPLGPVTIGVQAFPTFLFDRGVDPVEFLSELLERAEDDGFDPGGEQALHQVLDMMACKAAVKAGDRMSDLELAELVKLRDQVERSSSCPHGRPTSVRLTIRELDKLFKRT